MDYVDAGGTGDQGITVDDPFASQKHWVWLWHERCGKENDEQSTFWGPLPRSRAREVGIALELPRKLMGFYTAVPGFIVKEQDQE